MSHPHRCVFLFFHIDSAGEDPNASFNLYLEAAELFTQARARERHPKRQKLILDNATELITRAEDIRAETNKSLVETLELQKEVHEEMGECVFLCSLR